MINEQIVSWAEEIKSLSPQEQAQVMDFVGFLKAKRSKPEPKLRGTPGHTLRRFVGSIPPEDLKIMMEAIDKGCGQIDKEGWN